MATCPHCGTAVPDDAAACPACGAALARPAADVEVHDCPNCGADVPADAGACPACGHLHVSAACAVHPERAAEGACVVCGRALCPDCDKGSGTEYVCQEHAEVPLMDGWAEVYSTGDDVEADLVRDALEADGIDAQVLSQKDHFSFTVDLGDLARVRVLVPAFEYEEARQSIANRGTLSRDLPVTCPACGTAYEPGDATCTACGASLVEEAPGA